MTRFKAVFKVRIALILIIVLGLLAACDTSGIPAPVGTPEAAATSTPEVVAVAPTPTLEEFFPVETETPVIGGGTEATSTPRRPRATDTPESAPEATSTAEPTTEPTSVANGEPTPTLMPEDDRMALFDDVWGTVDDNYLYPDFHGLDWDASYDKYAPIARNAGTSTEFYTAISDMVGELKDDHSRYLSPQEAREEDDLQGGNANYVGVGIISSAQEKAVMVAFVFAGSPAEKAGLKRRDKIVAIDGEPIEDPSIISGRIRGPEGTTVRLSVVSPGQPERVVPIVRGKITGAITPTSSRLERDTSIGYLIIPDLFTEDMGYQVGDELEKLLNDSPRLTGLVIDLRGNGGGFRTVLEQILSYFVEGKVGTFFDQDNSYAFQVVGDFLKDELDDIPVVVLIDGGAESYAEVLASAIQEKGRAKVVGVHSAGNTETIFQYNFDDGSRLWCAQEGFERLDGTNMEGTGVIPDFEILDDWTGYSESNDPHILKAIEIIKQQ